VADGSTYGKSIWPSLLALTLAPIRWTGSAESPPFATCVLLMGAVVIAQFFARSLVVLLVGELLGGVVLGTFVVIAPAYASEVYPTALRGHLTAYVNLCLVMGQLLANGVTTATSRLANHWANSVPFAI
jgi:MFS transporter, SP family, general alpha glucoside:H+ symporter